MSEFAPLPSLRLLYLEDDQRNHGLLREIFQVQNFEGDIQKVQTRKAFQNHNGHGSSTLSIYTYEVQKNV